MDRITVFFGLVYSTEPLPAMGAIPSGMPPDRPAPKEIGMEKSTSKPVKKQNAAFAEADKQAAHIKRIKNKSVKKKQIDILCETWKRALRGFA